MKKLLFSINKEQEKAFKEEGSMDRKGTDYGRIYEKKRDDAYCLYSQRAGSSFAQQITGAIDQELERGAVKQLVFDFSDTDFMDSSGIGMLMGRKRLLSYSGGTVSAIHVNDRILRIMQLSGIYKHIEISQEPVWNHRKR